MRVDLEELELKHASSIHRRTGVAVVNEDDLASIITELCAARDVVAEAREAARFFGDDYPAYTEPLNRKLEAYDAATKGDG